jgi:c-di-GMP-binding flagellar brake protein YcgR
MVFGFSKSSDLRALNQRMGRFLNSIRYSDLETEKQRTESRIRLAQPCIGFPFSEADTPRSYAVGITRDISLHGMSMLVEGALEKGEYILVFGDDDGQIMVRANCIRCVREKFGMFSLGFTFSKLLSESAYPAILNAVAYLNSSKSDQPAKG